MALFLRRGKLSITALRDNFPEWKWSCYMVHFATRSYVGCCGNLTLTTLPMWPNSISVSLFSSSPKAKISDSGIKLYDSDYGVFLGSTLTYAPLFVPAVAELLAKHGISPTGDPLPICVDELQDDCKAC